MPHLRPHLHRLRGLFRRRSLETEMNEELRAHLEGLIDRNLAAGMPPDEARFAALREFGGIEQIKERARDERRFRWLEEFFSDIRFAARSLRKSPGFTTVAVLTLALCIGANSAVFSVVRAILLKPYPWPDSERLVSIRECSVPDYLDRREGVTSFAESALWHVVSLNLAATDSTPERVSGIRVTPSLFPLLKARPALGRTFTDDDTAVVVLSDAFWRNHFAANPKIIGTEIRLDGFRFTVVGVMPPSFYFPGPETQLWLQFRFTDREKSDSERLRGAARMVARLKPGATIAQAQAEVTAIYRANAERLPQLKAAWEAKPLGGEVVGFLETNVKDVRSMLWLVQCAVAAVLLIGCTNVASLMLARASARDREFAIRAALGASRIRLIRHMLTESMLLFVGGGLCGLLLASWSITALNNLGVDNLPRAIGVSLDVTVFAFTLACAVITGLAFGALPASSATRGNNTDALKDAGARATTGRRHLSLRSALVVGQVALALMLLATAALLLKSFARLQQVSPGFVRENVLTAMVWPSFSKYNTPEKKELFHDQLLERVRALPGVISAASMLSFLPFSPQNENLVFYQVDGVTTPDGQPQPKALLRWVSPDYFKTMGITLLRGREFTEQDRPKTDSVAIIDRVLAERYWPGEDPIGKQLFRGTPPAPNAKWQPKKSTIVGVVAPVKHASLELPVTQESVYLSILQEPGTRLTLVVKIAGAPTQLAAGLRAAVLALDPELPLFDIKTMEARIEESMQGRRTPMVLVALFAGISLLLAALGVYGVLAFAVGQRTQEIGVRVALGATRANILQLIVGQGVRLVALGVVLGLGGYFALGTLIRELLFSVEPTDYAALVIAPVTLALVALAACLIPARRATKVDPIVALRAE